MRYYNSVTVILVGALLVGCLPEKVPTDAWNVNPPGDISWQRVPQERVHVVSATSLANAVAAVELLPAVALDLATASSLVGSELSAVEGMTPYLVRALAVNGIALADGDVSVDVDTTGALLWMDHHPLGFGNTTSFTRWPVVVFLSVQPTSVYATGGPLPI